MHIFSSKRFSTTRHQRALIADALCGAENALPGSIQPVINYEIDYWQSKHP